MCLFIFSPPVRLPAQLCGVRPPLPGGISSSPSIAFSPSPSPLPLPLPLPPSPRETRILGSSLAFILGLFGASLVTLLHSWLRFRRASCLVPNWRMWYSSTKRSILCTKKKRGDEAASTAGTFEPSSKRMLQRPVRCGRMLRTQRRGRGRGRERGAGLYPSVDCLSRKTVDHAMFVFGFTQHRRLRIVFD